MTDNILKDIIRKCEATGTSRPLSTYAYCREHVPLFQEVLRARETIAWLEEKDVYDDDASITSVLKRLRGEK